MRIYYEDADVKYNTLTFSEREIGKFMSWGLGDGAGGVSGKSYCGAGGAYTNTQVGNTEVGPHTVAQSLLKFEKY